jgi:hypothetical protein
MHALRGQVWQCTRVDLLVVQVKPIGFYFEPNPLTLEVIDVENRFCSDVTWFVHLWVQSRALFTVGTTFSWPEKSAHSHAKAPAAQQCYLVLESGFFELLLKWSAWVITAAVYMMSCIPHWRRYTQSYFVLSEASSNRCAVRRQNEGSLLNNYSTINGHSALGPAGISLPTFASMHRKVILLFRTDRLVTVRMQ